MDPRRFARSRALALAIASCGCGGGGEDTDATEEAASLAAGEAVVVVDTLARGQPVSDGVAIATSRAAARPVVVYSVPVGGLAPSDRLKIVGTIYVSACTRPDVKP